MIFPLKPPFIIWLRQINRGYHIFSAKKFWNDPSLRLSYFRLDPAPSVQRTSEEFYRNATTGKSTLKIIIKHRQTKTQLPFIETIYIISLHIYSTYILSVYIYIYTYMNRCKWGCFIPFVWLPLRWPPSCWQKYTNRGTEMPRSIVTSQGVDESQKVASYNVSILYNVVIL
jgi:hypothetical protein